MDYEKKLDKSLEEAAEKFAEAEWDGLHDGDGNPLYTSDYIEYTFKAGAKWQKSQMLKDAVGGTVHHALNCHYIMTDQQALNDRLREIPEGTKVNIYICKAKED